MPSIFLTPPPKGKSGAVKLNRQVLLETSATPTKSFVSSLSNVSSASPSVKLAGRFRIEMMDFEDDESAPNLVSDEPCPDLLVALLPLRMPPTVTVYYATCPSDWPKVRK